MHLPDNQFHGKPCRTCGRTLRYVTAKPCGKCVACASVQQKRERGGSIEVWSVDHSITAATSQPTKQGKPCVRCGSTVRYAQSKKGVCVRCHKQWRTHYEKSKPKYFNSLYRDLGITIARYQEMCEAQDWRCAICKRVPKKLIADHCHSEGAFRGLICTHCNSGLGFFRDDTEVMQAAIEYLRAC